MNIRNIVTALALLAGVGFAMPAHAADGWTSSRVNLRTGPDSSYRMITSIPRGTPVQINGCLRSWTWCDVSVRNTRGWMAGTFIQANDRNRRSYIIESGPYANVPIVVYRDRDWRDDHRGWRDDHDDNGHHWGRDDADRSGRHDRDRYPGYGWNGGWRHDYND